MNAANQTRQIPGSRRGFSIAELLVVFVIIGIVISILIPAVAGVRQTARRAATNALMKDLATASNLFSNDRKGQAPGYFSARDMGSVENGAANSGRGLSGMQNVLLDLAGGIVQNEQANEAGDPCAEVGGPSVVRVNPTSDNAKTVLVNISTIGSPIKDVSRGVDVRAYFNPSGANYARQCSTMQRLGNVVGHQALPELVDAWGNPILAWTADTRATDIFAAMDSSGQPAKFYWNSNAGILRAQQMGRGSKDHSSVNSSLYSLIGGGMASSNPARVAASDGSGLMAALLGNPAFPKTNTGTGPLVPSAARGAVIFHSAGQDGWFLGSEDKGGRAANAPSGPGSVTLNYTSGEDPILLFDDIISSALN